MPTACRSRSATWSAARTSSSSTATASSSTRSGAVVARARQFEQDLLLWELDGAASAPARAPLSDLDEVYAALVLGVGDYTRKNGFERVLVGLSGGIDSALVALLAADALGPERLSCVVMPSPHSSPEHPGRRARDRHATSAPS